MPKQPPQQPRPRQAWRPPSRLLPPAARKSLGPQRGPQRARTPAATANPNLGVSAAHSPASQPARPPGPVGAGGASTLQQLSLGVPWPLWALASPARLRFPTRSF